MNEFQKIWQKKAKHRVVFAMTNGTELSEMCMNAVAHNGYPNRYQQVTNFVVILNVEECDGNLWKNLVKTC